MINTLLKQFSDFLTGPFLIAVIFVLFRAALYSIAERNQRAHGVPYRTVWWRDGLAWLGFSFVVVPIAQAADALIAVKVPFPHAVLSWPYAIRFVAYFVFTDFTYYLVHRLMHTTHVWRIHKWHHTPTYMYWFAGVRGSLLQTMLVSLPFIIMTPLVIGIPPAWVAFIMFVKNQLQNDWMHLNVRWGNKWLESVLVTPRYHHIHHSDNPEHYRRNMGITFTWWDRMFGTYIDPETVRLPLSFGIKEKVPLVRLALGI